MLSNGINLSNTHVTVVMKLKDTRCDRNVDETKNYDLYKPR